MSAVVLVHGAWHGAWCWDGVVKALSERGVPAIALELPLTGFEDDVALTRAAIESAGDHVVVCGHSYGGAVISEAAADLPGVKRLVFIAALMLDSGEDMATLMLGEPSLLLQALVVTDEGITVDPGKIHQVFYGDGTAEAARAIAPLLRPMPLTAGAATVGGEPAWKQVASTFVVCTNDQATPPSRQRILAERATDVVEWPTDHSPFLSRPAQVAELLASYS
ncbi:MAG: putative hydrolase [Mycobacterium sp.]|jgi:pimeloyl-ACP methyl ester carboxylesterase|nr:putative hydrolase [Mycobacterium sp.]